MTTLPSILVKRQHEDLRQMRKSTLCTLTMLLDLKDLNTGLHATRLAEWAVRVGERMGLRGDELSDIEYASLLHDIGKVGIPDAILLKPGRLSDEEMKVVKRHPEFGWAILRNMRFLERASLLVLHHHERWDGKGYPAGLQGGEIPLGARIVAVVDAFDAMISNRSYRDGLAAAEALLRLRQSSGTQFDPEIVDLFSRMVEANLEEVARATLPAA